MMYQKLFESDQFKKAVQLTSQAAEECRCVVIKNHERQYTLEPDACYWTDITYGKSTVVHTQMPVLGAVTTVFCFFQPEELDSLEISIQ